MVTPTSRFMPVMLKGMTIHPEDPLAFDFIIDSGNTAFQQAELKAESAKLVKYFLASLTVPRDQLWVNLSPEEKDRIIPEALGRTGLGQDLLAQDYLLKQLTASLMYPEDELGKRFWDKVYQQAQEQYGTTDIPLETFNKVWIIPEKAGVYEHNNTVYVTESKLKVLTDADYWLTQDKGRKKSGETKDSSDVLPTGRQAIPTGRQASHLTSDIIKSIIIPAIEKEVNEGETFAPLRQIYHSLILAKWYKQTLKNSILNQTYADQNKTAGIENTDKAVKEKIYAQYMAAYKKGVYDYMREEYDPVRREVVPRKYFSGGFTDVAMPIERQDTARAAKIQPVGEYSQVAVALEGEPLNTEAAESSAIQLDAILRRVQEKKDHVNGIWQRSLDKTAFNEKLPREKDDTVGIVSQEFYDWIRIPQDENDRITGHRFEDFIKYRIPIPWIRRLRSDPEAYIELYPGHIEIQEKAILTKYPYIQNGLIPPRAIGLKIEQLYETRINGAYRYVVANMPGRSTVEQTIGFLKYMGVPHSKILIHEEPTLKNKTRWYDRLLGKHIKNVHGIVFVPVFDIQGIAGILAGPDGTMQNIAVPKQKLRVNNHQSLGQLVRRPDKKNLIVLNIRAVFGQTAADFIEWIENKIHQDQLSQLSKIVFYGTSAGINPGQLSPHDIVLPEQTAWDIFAPSRENRSDPTPFMPINNQGLRFRNELQNIMLSTTPDRVTTLQSQKNDLTDASREKVAHQVRDIRVHAQGMKNMTTANVGTETRSTALSWNQDLDVRTSEMELFHIAEGVNRLSLNQHPVEFFAVLQASDITLSKAHSNDTNKRKMSDPGYNAIYSTIDRNIADVISRFLNEPVQPDPPATPKQRIAQHVKRHLPVRWLINHLTDENADIRQKNYNALLARGKNILPALRKKQEQVLVKIYALDQKIIKEGWRNQETLMVHSALVRQEEMLDDLIDAIEARTEGRNLDRGKQRRSKTEWAQDTAMAVPPRKQHAYFTTGQQEIINTFIRDLRTQIQSLKDTLTVIKKKVEQSDILLSSSLENDWETLNQARLGLNQLRNEFVDHPVIAPLDRMILYVQDVFNPYSFYNPLNNFGKNHLQGRKTRRISREDALSVIANLERSLTRDIEEGVEKITAYIQRLNFLNSQLHTPSVRDKRLIDQFFSADKARGELFQLKPISPIERFITHYLARLGAHDIKDQFAESVRAKKVWSGNFENLIYYVNGQFFVSNNPSVLKIHNNGQELRYANFPQRTPHEQQVDSMMGNIESYISLIQFVLHDIQKEDIQSPANQHRFQRIQLYIRQLVELENIYLHNEIPKSDWQISEVRTLFRSFKNKTRSVLSPTAKLSPFTLRYINNATESFLPEFRVFKELVESRQFFEEDNDSPDADDEAMITEQDVDEALRILGLDRKADVVDLKERTDRLLLQWHPVRNPNMEFKIFPASRRIIKAYQLIKDFLEQEGVKSFDELQPIYPAPGQKIEDAPYYDNSENPYFATAEGFGDQGESSPHKDNAMMILDNQDNIQALLENMDTYLFHNASEEKLREYVELIGSENAQVREHILSRVRLLLTMGDRQGQILSVSESLLNGVTDRVSADDHMDLLADKLTLWSMLTQNAPPRTRMQAAVRLARLLVYTEADEDAHLRIGLLAIPSYPSSKGKKDETLRKTLATAQELLKYQKYKLNALVALHSVDPEEALRILKDQLHKSQDYPFILTLILTLRSLSDETAIEGLINNLSIQKPGMDPFIRQSLQTLIKESLISLGTRSQQNAAMLRQRLIEILKDSDSFDVTSEITDILLQVKQLKDNAMYTEEAKRDTLERQIRDGQDIDLETLKSLGRHYYQIREQSIQTMELEQTPVEDTAIIAEARKTMLDLSLLTLEDPEATESDKQIAEDRRQHTLKILRKNILDIEHHLGFPANLNGPRQQTQEERQQAVDDLLANIATGEIRLSGRGVIVYDTQKAYGELLRDHPDGEIRTLIINLMKVGIIDETIARELGYTTDITEFLDNLPSSGQTDARSVRQLDRNLLRRPWTVNKARWTLTYPRSTALQIIRAIQKIGPHKKRNRGDDELLTRAYGHTDPHVRQTAKLFLSDEDITQGQLRVLQPYKNQLPENMAPAQREKYFEAYLNIKNQLKDMLWPKITTEIIKKAAELDPDQLVVFVRDRQIHVMSHQEYQKKWQIPEEEGGFLFQDTTWEELTRQGYRFRKHPGFDPRSLIVGDVVFEDSPQPATESDTQAQDAPYNPQVVIYVYPKVKTLFIHAFDPGFPEPTTPEEKTGKGRALLRHLLTPSLYKGYLIFGTGNEKMQRSFKKMREFMPLAKIHDPQFSLQAFDLLAEYRSRISLDEKTRQNLYQGIEVATFVGIVPDKPLGNDERRKARSASHAVQEDFAMIGRPLTLNGARYILKNYQYYPPDQVLRAIRRVLRNIQKLGQQQEIIFNEILRSSNSDKTKLKKSLFKKTIITQNTAALKYDIQLINDLQKHKNEGIQKAVNHAQARYPKEYTYKKSQDTAMISGPWTKPGARRVLVNPDDHSAAEIRNALTILVKKLREGYIAEIYIIINILKKDPETFDQSTHPLPFERKFSLSKIAASKDFMLIRSMLSHENESVQKEAEKLITRIDPRLIDDAYFLQLQDMAMPTEILERLRKPWTVEQAREALDDPIAKNEAVLISALYKLGTYMNKQKAQGSSPDPEDIERIQAMLLHFDTDVRNHAAMHLEHADIKKTYQEAVADLDKPFVVRKAARNFLRTDRDTSAPMIPEVIPTPLEAEVTIISRLPNIPWAMGFITEQNIESVQYFMAQGMPFQVQFHGVKDLPEDSHFHPYILVVPLLDDQAGKSQTDDTAMTAQIDNLTQARRTLQKIPIDQKWEHVIQIRDSLALIREHGQFRDIRAVLRMLHHPVLFINYQALATAEALEATDNQILAGLKNVLLQNPSTEYYLRNLEYVLRVKDLAGDAFIRQSRLIRRVYQESLRKLLGRIDRKSVKDPHWQTLGLKNVRSVVNRIERLELLDVRNRDNVAAFLTELEQRITRQALTPDDVLAFDPAMTVSDITPEKARFILDESDSYVHDNVKLALLYLYKHGDPHLDAPRFFRFLTHADQGIRKLAMSVINLSRLPSRQKINGFTAAALQSQDPAVYNEIMIELEYLQGPETLKALKYLLTNAPDWQLRKKALSAINFIAPNRGLEFEQALARLKARLRRNNASPAITEEILFKHLPRVLNLDLQGLDYAVDIDRHGEITLIPRQKPEAPKDAATALQKSLVSEEDPAMTASAQKAFKDTPEPRPSDTLRAARTLLDHITVMPDADKANQKYGETTGLVNDIIQKPVTHTQVIKAMQRIVSRFEVKEVRQDSKVKSGYTDIKRVNQFLRKDVPQPVQLAAITAMQDILARLKTQNQAQAKITQRFLMNYARAVLDQWDTTEHVILNRALDIMCGHYGRYLRNKEDIQRLKAVLRHRDPVILWRVVWFLRNRKLLDVGDFPEGSFTRLRIFLQRISSQNGKHRHYQNLLTRVKVYVKAPTPAATPDDVTAVKVGAYLDHLTARVTDMNTTYATQNYLEHLPRKDKASQRADVTEALVMAGLYNPSDKVQKQILKALLLRITDPSRQDTALPAQEAPGGIDLNRIDINRSGQGSRATFEIKPRNDNAGPATPFKGFTPVIINITPIPNIYPLLGMNAQGKPLRAGLDPDTPNNGAPRTRRLSQDPAA
jgi:hypothetical protein